MDRGSSSGREGARPLRLARPVHCPPDTGTGRRGSRARTPGGEQHPAGWGRRPEPTVPPGRQGRRHFPLKYSAATQGSVTDGGSSLRRLRNGILFSNKKKRVIDSCGRMDDSERHFAA